MSLKNNYNVKNTTATTTTTTIPTPTQLWHKIKMSQLGILGWLVGCVGQIINHQNPDSKISDKYLVIPPSIYNKIIGPK